MHDLTHAVRDVGTIADIAVLASSEQTKSVRMHSKPNRGYAQFGCVRSDAVAKHACEAVSQRVIKVVNHGHLCHQLQIEKNYDSSQLALCAAQTTSANTSGAEAPSAQVEHSHTPRHSRTKHR